MMEIQYTLISDGPSDKVLMPVLDWLIRTNGYDGSLQGEFCDFRLLKKPSSYQLADKIKYGLRLFPCDLLFIHRDAERASRQRRLREISRALNIAFCNLVEVPAVCVIPVRMTECWLLFDESAIRRAAGNSNGQQALSLPPLHAIESLPNPKDVLRKVIIQASELNARRKRRFEIGSSVHQITQFIDDFSPLRSVSAFTQLETDLNVTMSGQGWIQGDD